MIVADHNLKKMLTWNNIYIQIMIQSFESLDYKLEWVTKIKNKLPRVLCRCHCSVILHSVTWVQKSVPGMMCIHREYLFHHLKQKKKDEINIFLSSRFINRNDLNRAAELYTRKKAAFGKVNSLEQWSQSSSEFRRRARAALILKQNTVWRVS